MTPSKKRLRPWVHLALLLLVLAHAAPAVWASKVVVDEQARASELLSYFKRSKRRIEGGLIRGFSETIGFGGRLQLRAPRLGVGLDIALATSQRRGRTYRHLVVTPSISKVSLFHPGDIRAAVVNYGTTLYMEADPEFDVFGQLRRSSDDEFDPQPLPQGFASGPLPPAFWDAVKKMLRRICPDPRAVAKIIPFHEVGAFLVTDADRAPGMEFRGYNEMFLAHHGETLGWFYGGPTTRTHVGRYRVWGKGDVASTQLRFNLKVPLWVSRRSDLMRLVDAGLGAAQRLADTEQTSGIANLSTALQGLERLAADVARAIDEMPGPVTNAEHAHWIKMASEQYTRREMRAVMSGLGRRNDPNPAEDLLRFLNVQFEEEHDRFGNP